MTTLRREYPTSGRNPGSNPPEPTHPAAPRATGDAPVASATGLASIPGNSADTSQPGTQRRRPATPKVDARGYVRVGRQYEHRLIAERMLGRPLAAGEVVHHRNGRRSDNRPENLAVVTMAEHNRLHADERTRAGVPGPNSSVRLRMYEEGTLARPAGGAYGGAR